MTTFVESKLSRLAINASAPVVRVVLRHAPLNIIDIRMMEELAHTLADIETREDISVLVLSGEGKAFSAGVDVAAHASDKVEEMLNKFHAVVRALITTKKVTIAAVHGNCLGGGAELAMVCDIVYTSATAKWGFPEIKLGCFPPVACTALAALIGQKRSLELILTGRRITGIEAEKMGLANHAVADEKLIESIENAAQELIMMSPAALAVTKKAIYAWDSMHFDKGLARAEKIYLEELIKTADTQEGVRSFLEKREPRWVGK